MRKLFFIAVIFCMWAQGCFAAETKKKAIYISDMSKARPASALSSKSRQGKWQLITYESDEVSGTMAGAHSFIDAPDLTVPLNVKGWYGIYLGYWNFAFALDGASVVKAKLSDAPAFRQFHESASAGTQDNTYLREVFFDYVDLTGKNIVIGKLNGINCRKMYFAYVKLVPLSAEKIEQIKKDRADRSKRNLVATIDGQSYFHVSEYTKPEHILELVEQYRNSDVDKVLWAVNYGALTNYHSTVEGVSWAGDKDTRTMMAKPGTLNNDYVRGQRQMNTSLRAFDKKRIILQNIAAEHAHSMGLKFDIMFRLGIIGGIAPATWLSHEDSFVNLHPEFHQVTRDGTKVAKASYAFKEIRQLMLDIIEEAAGKIDTDGINLCFVRGPQFLRYEKPILDAFQDKYGEDARKVDPKDERLLAIRAGFMTEFVKDARKVLDKIGRRKGKHLELSVWVWPSWRNVWLGGKPIEEGLDVKGWIKDGLLDSVICQQGIDEDYIELGKKNNCKFILFTEYRGKEAMSPEAVTRAYGKGINDFAYWDVDAAQVSPENWNWIRRIGHRDEMAAWDAKEHKTKSIPLKTVNGRNVVGTLAQQVYSGG